MSADWAGALPSARTEDLVITESGRELLVYDTANHQLHQLNPLASTVWRSLDGIRNAADVLVLARATTGQEVTPDSIRLALSTLSDANLLSAPIETGSLLGNQSRRGFLKKMGIASIPAVVSVTVPLAVAHASSCPLGPGDLTCGGGGTPNATLLDCTGKQPGEACWKCGPDTNFQPTCAACQGQPGQVLVCQ